MSHFSNAVSAALDELGWSQTHLSELSGIPRPQVNRYARGTSSVEVASLEKLISVLPPPYDGSILQAYLRDLTPLKYGHLVEFSRGSYVREEPSELPSGLDPELRSVLVRLAFLALRHTEIRDLLASLLRVLSEKN